MNNEFNDYINSLSNVERQQVFEELQYFYFENANLISFFKAIDNQFKQWLSNNEMPATVIKKITTNMQPQIQQLAQLKYQLSQVENIDLNPALQKQVNYICTQMILNELPVIHQQVNQLVAQHTNIVNNYKQQQIQEENRRKQELEHKRQYEIQEQIRLQQIQEQKRQQEEFERKEKAGDITWETEKTGFFIDQRDFQKYRVVKICHQIWMAENLHFKTSTGCWAYENKFENAKQFGYLYDWNTACSVAPKGWHLPSKEDFEQLINFLESTTPSVRNALISGGSSGFSALFGGRFLPDRCYFHSIGETAFFWSSSPMDETCCWKLELWQQYGIGWYPKDLGLSVRCIKT